MSNEKHRLLERQMKRHGIDLEKNPELTPFIKALNRSYNQFEKEQKILNNSSTKLIEKIRLTNQNLETTIETIDSFNYHVSHDLKTIITNSIGLAQMATKYFDRDNGEKLSIVLKRLESNSKAGLITIKKYLEISKIDSKISTEKTANLNIHTAIRNILVNTSLLHELEVTVVRNDFDYIKMNEVSLNSILQNFITNAHKYAQPEKKPILEISLEQTKNATIFRFKDNGIGIDLTRNRDKIFQPFVRIDNEEIEGSGVGLYIVKKIINRLGGHITVESTIGLGTTFSLEIPNNSI